MLILAVVNAPAVVAANVVVPLATVKPPPNVANPVFDNVPTLEIFAELKILPPKVAKPVFDSVPALENAPVLL